MRKNLLICSVAAPVIHEATLPEWIHLVPIGKWCHTATGRELDLPRETVQQIFERAQSYKTSMMVDYEHRSHLPRPPEDADGRDNDEVVCYIDRFEMRDDGIWGHVEMWTSGGARDILAAKFRYISPVLNLNKSHRVTGEVGPELIDAAVTNHPNLDGINALFAETTAGVGEPSTTSTKGEKTMLEKMRKRLIALGVTLADDAGEDAVLEAFDELAAQPPATDGDDGDSPDVAPVALAQALGVDGEITMTDAMAKVLQLKTENIKAGDIDQAAIIAAAVERVADTQLMLAAVADGRVPQAMQKEYEALLFSDDPKQRGSVRKIIADLKPTGPLAPGLGKGGARPDSAEGGGKYFAEACDQLGLDPENAKKILAGEPPVKPETEADNG